MEVEGSSKKMIATQEEMVEARVPLAYRDQCAHLLIPLNKCRQAEFYLPWKCENERHSYEKALPPVLFLSFPNPPMLDSFLSVSLCESLLAWGCSFMFFYFMDSCLPWNVCPETSTD
ncbi:hypothetical protein P8452_10943 [Trifolium repens]|nr:hypothetical protein P8452_10943 [Trifolium repens]